MCHENHSTPFPELDRNSEGGRMVYRPHPASLVPIWLQMFCRMLLLGFKGDAGDIPPAFNLRRGRCRFEKRVGSYSGLVTPS